MAIERLEAIVLRSYPLRDTSRIVHLLTLERGHVKVVAKGARTPRSRFGAALEPFTQIRAVIYYKAQRDLQLLSQADIVCARRVLGRSVVRFAYASAVIELLEQVLAGEEAHAPLYEEVAATLSAIETAPEAELRARFMGFVLRLLALLGYRPELERCVVCERPIAAGRGFDALRGGVVCGACYAGDPGAQPLSEAGRRLMQRLGTSMAGERLERATGDEVARVLDVFLRMHLPSYRRLRSLELVRASGEAWGGLSR
ncbi:MAG: DNA repair protein RecO [Candidatus Eiseniibacteriota bacterium]|jgi:DNA repair protein RecO (recombination protein O)